MFCPDPVNAIGLGKANTPLPTPAVSRSTAVSPMAAPTPSKIPVIAPGDAERKTAFFIVCHFVAPRA